MQTFFKATAVGIALLTLSGCTPVQPVNQTDNQRVSQPQTTIKITGAGSVYPALQVLAKTYTAKVKNTQITFLPNNQTSGGITGVKNDIADIGAVTRALKSEEDNGQIQYREIAKDALILATNHSVQGVKDLQAKDLKAIYSGEVINWQQLGGSDAKIILLDRPEDESAKKLLRESYLGKGLKITSTAIVLKQESELAQSLQDTPNAVGTFALGYAITKNLQVNRLNIDGIAPTTDNVANGKYKMVRTLGIVTKKIPSAATQEFIQFIFSTEGTKTLLESGFVASTTTQKTE